MNKVLNKSKSEKVAYLFILPALLLFILFFLYPLISSVRYSFLDWSRSIYPEGFVGFKHYINIFTLDTVFRTSIINNLKVFLVVIIVQLSLPIFLALLLDTKIKGRAFLRLVYFSPVLISWIMIAAIWKYIFIPNFGLYANIIDFLNLSFLNSSLLGDPKYALYIVIFVICWQSIGFNMVIFLANLQSIPQDLIEAAIVDGASEWAIISKIKIPLLRPSINIVAVLSVIGVFKIYEAVAFITNGGPGYSTYVLTFYMVRRIGTGFQFAYACALSTITTVIIILITIFINQVIFNKRFEIEY